MTPSFFSKCRLRIHFFRQDSSLLYIYSSAHIHVLLSLVSPSFLMRLFMRRLEPSYAGCQFPIFAWVVETSKLSHFLTKEFSLAGAGPTFLAM
jgi:hypothetical protein